MSWRISGSSRVGRPAADIEFDDWGASWGRALFVWVYKGGFMLVLVASGGLTGGGW